MSSDCRFVVPPQLVNICENYMSLMGDSGDIREDLRVPDSEVGKEIEARFEAGEDFLVSVRSHITVMLTCDSLLRGGVKAGSDCAVNSH